MRNNQGTKGSDPFVPFLKDLPQINNYITQNSRQ